MRVSLYEDEKLLQDLYKKKFKDSGLELIVYINPPKEKEDLIQQVLTDKPDLIISSIIMPVKDGMTAIEELKSDSRTKNIPVMILTNNAGADLHARAADLGVVSYMVKAKYVPSQVVERVKKILNDETWEDVG
jgi:CheY-like chemotaxis protein